MKAIVAKLSAALCIVAALSPVDSSAQTAETWKWQLGIYGYVPDFGAKMNLPTTETRSGASLDGGTIIDNLKFTFMGTLGAHNGRWGAFTDVIYLDLGNSKSAFRDLSFGGVTLPGGVNANVNLDLKAWVWTLGADWRVSSDPNSTVDVLAGARMLDVTPKLAYELTGNIGSLPLPSARGGAEATLRNWDAIVGIKGRATLGEDRKWFVPWYLDVGTGQSKVTYQAMVGVGYAFGWGDLLAAWRYLRYNMKSGDAIDNMDTNGPGIAVVFHF